MQTGINKDYNLLLKIRNYKTISKMFLSDENVNYMLRKLFERHMKRAAETYKFPEIKEG